jgi:serine/threonine protein kinase
LFSSQYVITGRLLGAGGYGKVMVAIHQDTQRQVACKVIDLQRLRSTMPAPTTEARRGSLARTSLDRKSASKRQWNKHIARYFREFDVLKDLSHVSPLSKDNGFCTLTTSAEYHRHPKGVLELQHHVCTSLIALIWSPNCFLATFSKNSSPAVIYSRMSRTRVAASTTWRVQSSSGSY